MQDDLQRLQGHWHLVRFEENGVVEPHDTHSAPGAILTIDGNHFHVAVPGQASIVEGSFVLGATLLSPRAIDWTDATGEDAGKTFPAIYTLANNEFAFLAADAGMPRPERFGPEGCSTGQGLTLRKLVRLSP